MEYRVKYSSKAELELGEDVAWVLSASQSPEVAFKWFNRLMSEIESLAHMPGRCPIARESAELGMEIRQLLCGHGRYRRRALFTIVNDTVWIIGIRHSSRGEE